MAESAAMTVDFLRARLLSERSVSRAAKERADELAKRVAELEEQVRERAAEEVLAILDSQGFGAHLSDDADDDSGTDRDGEEEEDVAKSRADAARVSGEEEEPSVAAPGEADDALSGTVRPGGLSWKGRSVSPRKARQLKQKSGRRGYFYLLSSSDSSPKYRMGQSCRKNKRQMLMSNHGRMVSPGEDGGDVVSTGSHKERQDGSDCTDDGPADLDGEVGGGERSSGDGGVGQYVIRYQKGGEMERVLERQAELIGQYEEEEKAQREWEEKYNENRNANKVAAEAEHKPCQVRNGEDSRLLLSQGASQVAPCDDEVLPNGSLSESQGNGAQLREANDKPSAQTASISAQESSSTVTKQSQNRGDENSDGDSGHAQPHQHCVIKTPSERSPSSDTLNSKVSDWSSSHFHDHADSQLDTRSYGSASSNVDVGSVLEALQRARISLSAKLSKPVPPSQVMLALPAPGDESKEDYDLPAEEGSNSYREEHGSSSPARQEILALPAPEDYQEFHGRVDLPVINDTGIPAAEKPTYSSPPREDILALPAPGDDYRREIEDDMKVPVCTPGLFRLPTDSFPVDQTMFSRKACGSGFSLGSAATRHATGCLSNPGAHNTAATEAPSVSGDDSGFSVQQCFDLYSSLPSAGRCNSMARPDFCIHDTSFLSGVPGLGDADLFMQRGIDYTISNQWMLK
ncbi:hypothetical protein EJB05_18365 [Eragrostis curvula]|uniref:Uncharacterized protein n=1 Tax=Eragrostis curvula TaxID=38414 RepID=A0A5J9VLG0_9POAL|nr:hypothetical protein EJB05_18365 [Eragrostis curvula]